MSDWQWKAQGAGVRAIIGRVPVFVPRIVLLEAEWVLRAVYKLPLERAVPALRGFVGLPGVSAEETFVA